MNAPPSTYRHRSAVRPRRRGLAAAGAALIVLAACTPSPAPPPASARTDGWREFEGSWNAAGSRHALMFDRQRRASLLDLRGTLLLAGPSRPGVGFRGEVIALVDATSGLTGRAVWTDERGDQVFSELRGEGTASRNRITGTIVDGTGRYAGASGSYEFSWQYFLDADDGVVQGRTEGLKGRVRMDRQAAAAAPLASQAASAPPAAGSRP